MFIFATKGPECFSYEIQYSEMYSYVSCIFDIVRLWNNVQKKKKDWLFMTFLILDGRTRFAQLLI